jgi:hypothetical protein
VFWLRVQPDESAGPRIRIERACHVAGHSMQPCSRKFLGAAIVTPLV